MPLLTKKPKIAILSIRNSYNYGGVLSSLKVVYSFCQQYFDPTVFFLSFDHSISTSLRNYKFTSTTKPLTYFGMNCVEIGARWSFWEPGHYYFTRSMWEKHLNNYDYFFVVSGTCIAAHPLTQLNKKFVMWIGTPYCYDREERVKQLSGGRYLLDRLAQKSMLSIEKNILEKSNFTWAISSYAKNHFEQILHYETENLQLCGYPIDCTQAPQLTQIRKENIVLAVGRFSDPRKNIDMLIRVFSKLHQIVPDLKLYVIGTKPSTEKLLSYSHLSCFANITFTGQVANEDLKNFYTRALVLLITSYQEGLGIVGLEALLHGTPVVATACGGTTDYVINNVTGYLTEVNDDNSMVERALEIIKNPSLHHALSTQGQKFIEQEFSVAKTYSRFKEGLAKTYEELHSWFEKCDLISFSSYKNIGLKESDLR